MPLNISELEFCSIKIHRREFYGEKKSGREPHCPLGGDKPVTQVI